MIIYNDILVKKVMTESYKWKDGKRSKLKKPIVNIKEIYTGSCYDLAEFYKLVETMTTLHGDVTITFKAETEL